jgi:hypothetical protein
MHNLVVTTNWIILALNLRILMIDPYHFTIIKVIVLYIRTFSNI